MTLVGLRQAVLERLKPKSDYKDLVEVLSEKFHYIYQQEARRQGDMRHNDDYGELAENIKEFDRVLARYILKRDKAVQNEAVSQALLAAAKEVEKTLNEIEEGFEGTAVEFCEKLGDDAYTGFKECLEELRKRLVVGLSKEKEGKK